MKRGIFITGTGTGVGKTLVTAGIVRYLRQHGLDAVPIKPVQTGVYPRSGSLFSPDIDFILAAANYRPGDDEIALMTPYIYELACSPHLAGRLAGFYPEMSHIRRCVAGMLETHAAVVIEGAGGLMTPINESHTFLDLIRELNCPTLVVALPNLGTINHTLLTIQALRAVGQMVLGVVFNTVTPLPDHERFIAEDNPRTVAQLGDVSILGNIRHLTSLSEGAADIWQCFEEDMPGLGRILELVEK